VNKLSYNEDEKRIIAERKLEDGVETVSAPLPALVVVLPDINSPRVPTLIRSCVQDECDWFRSTLPILRINAADTEVWDG
jgi:hypothetical protein